MAAADQQFLDALKYLGQEGQQYGIKLQMDDVNQRAQDIQSTMTDEIQRRQALRNLATQASLSVAGSGGNAQQAAAIQNLLPPIPTTVHQAYIQGALTGDKQMVGVANKMQQDDEARQMRMFERKSALELQIQDKKAGMVLKNDLIKSGIKEHQSLDGFLDSSSEYLASIRDARAALKAANGGLVDTGPLDQHLSWTSDNANRVKAAFAKLNTDMKLNIIKQAGSAKVADSEGEMKALAAGMPNTGYYSNENFRQLDNLESNLVSLRSKGQAKKYSLERSQYLSSSAYADEYTPRGKEGAGVTLQGATHPALRHINK